MYNYLCFLKILSYIMSNFESKNEKISLSEESNETGIDLLYLQNQIQLNQLKKDIAEFGEIWKFVSLWVSNDGNYDKYSYTVSSDLATPSRIRALAIIKRLASLKDIEWIQITDKNAKEYDDNHQFSSWDKVYVRIPRKNKQTKKINN